ncbi:MAG: FAD:protein transferase, partial [Solirubrobacteraceae bacterium]|nr:FAD:protein transferase [Solirubrobacteraceae bacterium]
MIETRTTFGCFGGECAISVLAEGPVRDVVDLQRARLLAWHDRFTCFDARSELMGFNADPREVVPASADLRRFAAAVAWAHALSGGLVDATLDSAVVKPHATLPLRLALRLAPPRRPARGRALPRIRVDDATVRRPPGLRLDSGGLAKGLFADLVARALAGHAAVAVDCAGDVRVTGMSRPVAVADPFGGP